MTHTNEDREVLAWAGLGHFGLAIALNCLERGFRVVGLRIDDHGTSGLAELRKAGGEVGAFEVLSTCDALVMCLPRPSDVADVVRRAGDRLPRVVIDASTGDPASAQALAKSCAEAGRFFVDAPVSGARSAARTGELVVFAGTNPVRNPMANRILSVIGNPVYYFGAHGLGQAAKLTNQLIHITNVGVIGEALHLAKNFDLDLDVLLPALRNASGGSKMLDRFGSSIAAEDFTPHFRLALAHKDLELVREMVGSQEELSDHRYLDATLDLCTRAMRDGLGELNFTAICRTITRAQ